MQVNKRLYIFKFEQLADTQYTKAVRRWKENLKELQEIKREEVNLYQLPYPSIPSLQTTPLAGCKKGSASSLHARRV